MPFNDFDVFWRAAFALLQGRDPYALSGVYYPLPTFFLFIPLAALPLPLARVVWSVIGVVILVAILRSRAFAVVLFMPVFLTFLMGQTVMLILGLFTLLRSGLFGGIALGLLMLKPQLFVLIVPWQVWQWRKRERRQIVWFGLVLATMAAIAFATRSDWVYRWLSVSGERMRAPISPSIWGVFSVLPAPWWGIAAGLMTISVLIWAWRKNDLDIMMAASLLVNPLLISYDLALLTVMVRESKIWLGLTVLSWVLFGVSAWQLNEQAFVLVPLAVIIVLLRQRRKRLSETARRVA